MNIHQSVARKPTNLLRLEINKALVQFRSGIHRSILAGHGSEIKSIRPYEPSDNLSAIDHMVSARVSEEPELQPMSRVYYTEKEISVVLLLDVGSTMSLMRRKQEHAALLLWLFGLSAFKYGDRFRIIPFMENVTRDSEWIRDEDTLQEFVDCGGLEIDNRFPFYTTPVFSYVRDIELRDAVLVVISDLARSWDREATMLRHLSYWDNNVKLILFALDEWSGFIPHRYGIRLFDEDGGALVVDDMREGGDVRMRMRAASAHFERIRKLVTRIGGVFIRIALLDDAIAVTYKEMMRVGFI